MGKRAYSGLTFSEYISGVMNSVIKDCEHSEYQVNEPNRVDSIYCHKHGEGCFFYDNIAITRGVEEAIDSFNPFWDSFKTGLSSKYMIEAHMECFEQLFPEHKDVWHPEMLILMTMKD